MVVDGTTLSPGGSAAVINGQTISDDVSGGLVGVGASGTSTLSPATSAGDGDAQTLAFGSLTVTASAVPGRSGAFVVDGTTLSPGGSGVAVGDGMTVSDRSGTLVEVGRSTTAAVVDCEWVFVFFEHYDGGDGRELEGFVVGICCFGYCDVCCCWEGGNAWSGSGGFCFGMHLQDDIDGLDYLVNLMFVSDWIWGIYLLSFR